MSTIPNASNKTPSLEKFVNRKSLTSNIKHDIKNKQQLFDNNNEAIYNSNLNITTQSPKKLKNSAALPTSRLTLHNGLSNIS
jgi:hypothetical protein